MLHFVTVTKLTVTKVKPVCSLLWQITEDSWSQKVVKMPDYEDPGLPKAREEAKEKFSFSDPENFFLKIDRTDPVAFAHARDEWFQARLVEVEMIKILKKRVEVCYGKDPVNHRQNCRKYVLDYLGAWQNYRDNKAFLRTPGGNIERFKPTLEEMYP